MKRTTVVLAGTAAVILLTGCGQEAALRSTDSGSSTLIGSNPSPSSTAVPTSAAPQAAAPQVGASSAAAADPAPATAAPGAPAPKVASFRPANAFDWDQPKISDEDLDRAVRAAWADAHDVPVERVVGDQLLLGLADEGRLLVGAYQLWVPGGQAYVVVAQAEPRSESVLVRDTLSRPDLGHVDGVVSMTAPYVVVAVAPGTTRVEYRSGSESPWEVVDQDSIDLVFPRAAASRSGEGLRLTRGATTVHPLSAPSGRASGSERPANLLAWPARGSAERGPSAAAASAAYATARNTRTAQATRLFSGDTDGGVRYFIGQAWTPGQPAQTIGYVLRPDREPELHIQSATPQGARVVALLVTEQPGTTTDLLVIVPEPRTTQVAYRSSPAAGWTEASTLPTLQGVALVDRAKAAVDDDLRLWAEGADSASPLVIGVDEVLCDGSSCR